MWGTRGGTEQKARSAQPSGSNYSYCAVTIAPVKTQAAQLSGSKDEMSWMQVRIKAPPSPARAGRATHTFPLHVWLQKAGPEQTLQAGSPPSTPLPSPLILQKNTDDDKTIVLSISGSFRVFALYILVSDDYLQRRKHTKDGNVRLPFHPHHTHNQPERGWHSFLPGLNKPRHLSHQLWRNQALNGFTKLVN